MSFDDKETFRGTCVLVDGQGVLLQGPSGSGKSDLALRLLDRGATLVADDYVDVAVEMGALIASPPRAIAGLIEVRGLGILAVPFAERAPLGVVISCVPQSEVTRLPEQQSLTIRGIAVPRFSLAALEASAPAKVRALVRALATGGFRSDSPSST
jgi:serine kinase of HPr protein (carbohydrate metabolism regulator)